MTFKRIGYLNIKILFNEKLAIEYHLIYTRDIKNKHFWFGMFVINLQMYEIYLYR